MSCILWASAVKISVVSVSGRCVTLRRLLSLHRHIEDCLVSGEF